LIRVAAVGYILAYFLLAFSGTLLVPLTHALLTDDPSTPSFVIAAGLCAAAGLSLRLLTRRPVRDVNQREGLLLVVVIWLAAVSFGCLPFYLSPHYASFTDAFFEAASGLTTTGATVLADVEVLSPSLQLWRCFTHWLGGMGIVLLGVAILPLIGHGGMQLYRAEFSGAKSEKLRPRIAETALSLWKIYVALTAAETLALWLAGMSAYEAVCHAFSTLGTGGFSTRTRSIAGFESPLIEWIVIVFMLLAGISFVQHYRLWMERRPLRFFRDVEVRTYLGVLLAATAVVGVSLVIHSNYDVAGAIRTAAFQVTSIVTTTGFVTADFELWHPFPQVLLLVLMYVGGCTGSTAGGLKVARMQLLARVVNREFKRMVERHGVFPVRLGGQVIAETAVQSLLNLVYLALLVNLVAVVALAAMGVDVLTSIAAVAASMFNIGPGLGGVGPAEHYGWLPAGAKWVLSGCMIAGRLEFYTVVVILTPAFWRK